MQHFIHFAAAILAFSILVTSSASPSHSVVQKRPETLFRECVTYLTPYVPNAEDCTFRCVGLIARFWDDCNGTSLPTIGQFYLPDVDDEGYGNRTEFCRQETVYSLPVENTCQRARCDLSCHDDQYGRLLVEKAHFVPFTRLQHQRVVEECLDVLQIEEDVQRLLLQGGLLAAPEGRCLLKCVMLREGLYSELEGPNLERFWVQTGGPGERFFQQALKCYSLLKLEDLDACTLAARFAAECLVSRVSFVSSVFQVFKSLHQQSEALCNDQ